MLLRSTCKRRHGAVILESAVVYPVFFIFTLGLVVVSMGVFRYQEVCRGAHDGARYVSVRGQWYSNETTQTSPAVADVSTFVKQTLVSMDPTQLTTTVTLNNANGTTSDWDASNKAVMSYTATSPPVLATNTVSVTVTYNWSPEFFFVGTTIPLTATSTVAMQY